MKPSSTDNENAIVDWAAVLTQFGGRQEFVARLSGIALQAHANLPNKIAQAVSARDLTHLGFLAHSVKGLCANFTAPTVLAVALETEKCAKDGNASRALPCGETLIPLVHALLDDIAGWQKDNAGQAHAKT